MDPEVIEIGAEVGKVALTQTTFYKDALQPVAVQTGKALETLGKTVNMALSPLAATVWGYEAIKNYLIKKLEEKLANVEVENIQTPKANVAVPIIEGLRNVSEDEDLQEMYANLLANAMNKKCAHGILPSFGEIIKQLTSDEAKLLNLFFQPHQRFPIVEIRLSDIDNAANKGWQVHKTNISVLGNRAGCTYPDQTPMYLDNLNRLGLINISYLEWYTDEKAYDEILENTSIKHFIVIAETEHHKKVDFGKGHANLTVFGRNFCNACRVNGEQR